MAAISINIHLPEDMSRVHTRDKHPINVNQRQCMTIHHKSHTKSQQTSQQGSRPKKITTGVETQKNVRGEIGGWGRVPFNEPYASSLSTIYDGA